MWRSVLLGVGLVLGVVLVGVLVGGGSGRPTGDTGVQSNAMTSQLDNGRTLPYHSVVVRGTRAFNPGELGVPLTVHCPQSGTTGFKQVIRTPLKVGLGVYGGSANGGGMTYVVRQSGAVTISC